VDEIRVPTFLVEGREMANGPSVEALYAARDSAPIRPVLIAGLDHFSVLAPGTEVVAEAIVADTGETRPTPRARATPQDEKTP